MRSRGLNIPDVLSFCVSLGLFGVDVRGFVCTRHAGVVWFQRPTMSDSQGLCDSHQIVDSALCYCSRANSSQQPFVKQFGIQTFLTRVDSFVVGVSQDDDLHTHMGIATKIARHAKVEERRRRNNESLTFTL
jgi:hypothetical protein